MFRRSLFIFFVFFVRNSSCVIDDLYNAGKEMWNLYSILDKISLNDNPIAEIVLKGNDSENQVIKIQIDKIFKNLDQIEKSMNPKKIADPLKVSKSDVILHSCLTGLELSIENIDDNYEKFYKYINGDYDNRDDSSGQFIKNIVITVEGDITWIRKLISEDHPGLPNRSNVVKAIAERSIRLHGQSCDGLQPTSSILVQLLRMVIIAEIKANLMLSVGNIYQYSQSSGWKVMNSFARQAFEEHLSRYVNVFHLNMNETDSLSLRACDPANGIWIRNKHFYEFEETIQTTIFHYHWTQCKFRSCNDVWSNQWDKCMPTIYDSRTSCSGITASCAYLGSIKACALTSGPYKFQYLNSTKLGPLGTNFTCPKDNGYPIEDGTGWNIHRGLCACDCYGNGNKISLSIMESRVRENWVITGIQVVRKNGILHIQPREGKLGANGHIFRYTERWIAIPKNPEVHRIDRKNKVFFLDDLRLPAFHVLTGVKFNKVIRGNITGFAIEIFGIPFDHESGIWNPKNTSHISEKASNIRSGTHLPFKRVSPIYVSMPQIPDSEGIGFVTLDRSELSADFGQSTLPFFDTVPIVTTPPSILGGIGLFHKGNADHAGFISLRVFGIPYIEYLSDFQLHYMSNGRISFDNSKNHAN